MIKKAVRELPVYYTIPILLIVAIVPLIVFLRVTPLDSITAQYWTGNENVDFFSYYKAIFLIILSLLSVVAVSLAKYNNLIKIKSLPIYYIPIAIYVLLIVLSTVTSKYPLTALNGFPDRYEGLYVLLSYLTVFFITINFINSEKLVNVFIISLFISAFILGTVGILQYFGCDLFQSDLARYLILPAQYRNLDMKFTFGVYSIYSTLYNTNYVGSYMAMLFPLSLSVFLYVKKTHYKIGMGILTCLMFANWLGSKSRAGYIGVAAALVILALLFRKTIIKNLKSVILLLLVFALIFAGMDSFSGGSLTKRILATVVTNSSSNPTQKSTAAITSIRLKDILISGNKASIITNINTLNMELTGNEIKLKDTDGRQLDVINNDSGEITFLDKNYELYNILFDSATNMFQIQIKSMKFNLVVQPDGFKILGERNVLLDKIDHAESFGFKGKEKYASARGYIWSRSIPLLKNNIIYGGGPDTYAIQFPQHDYVGKLIAFDTVGQIVDKPHNMYLQIGINTGVFSLLSVLFLFLVYVLSSVKIYFSNNSADKLINISKGIFCAVLGYIIAGLANDSLVSVAPVFWAILGAGISSNYLVSKGKNKLNAKNPPSGMKKVTRETKA